MRCNHTRLSRLDGLRRPSMLLLLLSAGLMACDDPQAPLGGGGDPVFGGGSGGYTDVGTAGNPAPGENGGYGDGMQAGSGGSGALGGSGGAAGDGDDGVDGDGGGTGGVGGDGDGGGNTLPDLWAGGDGDGDGDGDAGQDQDGVCGGDTPHGCYSIAPDQLAECPEKPPELPWKYMGCNGVPPAAACKYENAGKTFDCICDTGVHWLCFYID